MPPLALGRRSLLALVLVEGSRLGGRPVLAVATFGGRPVLTGGRFQWNATFGRRAVLAERHLFVEGQFFRKGTIWWKTSYSGRPLFGEGQFR